MYNRIPKLMLLTDGVRLASQLILGLKRIASKLKRLAARGIVPSLETLDISVVEAYTRMLQFQTEMHATTTETMRYKVHLKDDLELLLQERNKTDEAYAFVIEKKVKHLKNELETLDKSSLLDMEEDLNEESVYNSSCDNYSLDEI